MGDFLHLWWYDVGKKKTHFLSAFMFMLYIYYNNIFLNLFSDNFFMPSFPPSRIIDLTSQNPLEIGEAGRRTRWAEVPIDLFLCSVTFYRYRQMTPKTTDSPFISETFSVKSIRFNTHYNFSFCPVFVSFCQSIAKSYHAIYSRNSCISLWCTKTPSVIKNLKWADFVLSSELNQKSKLKKYLVFLRV